MANIIPIGFVNPTLVGASLALTHLERFNDDTRRQNHPGSAHRHTETIVLRGPEAPDQKNWYEDVPILPTPLLRDWPEALEFIAHAETLIQRAIQTHDLHLGKVMIVRLAAQSAVDWHVDTGSYAEAHVRFHVNLLPCWGAYLMSGAESTILTPGSLFLFNNRVLHSAVNFGDVPRVNMIIDARKPLLQ